MSTLTVRWPPTRVKLWSVSTRRILAWVEIGMSAISSRNRVPPWACSSRPGRASSPPSSTPNNSSSTRSGVIRAALTTMNGAVGARAPVVEQPRRHFLADPGRPGDQHPAARSPATRFSVARTALIATLEPVSSVSWPTCGREARILAPQPLGLGGAGDEVDEMAGLERLLDEVDRALADRRDRGVEIAVAGDHQHRQRRIAPLDLLEQLQPVELRALQPDVEQDQRRPPVAERLRAPRRCRRRCACVIAFVLEHARDEIPDVLLVVDDEDIESHDISTICRHALLHECCSAAAEPARALRCRRRAGRACRRPGASSNSIWPKCSSTIFLTMARPRPVPLARVVI